MPPKNPRSVVVALDGNGYVKLALWRHAPFGIAKQPAVNLIPTFEVVVAEPFIFNPARVVVPNPSEAIDKSFLYIEDVATSNTGVTCVEGD